MENNKPKAPKGPGNSSRKEHSGSSREDSGRKSSDTSTYSQFMKDKRKRVTRVEKNERDHSDKREYTRKPASDGAKKSDKPAPSSSASGEGRRSFNPNFTKENKVIGGARKSSRSPGGTRSATGKRAYEADDRRGEEDRKPYVAGGGTRSEEHRKPYVAGGGTRSEEDRKPYVAGGGTRSEEHRKPYVAGGGTRSATGKRAYEADDRRGEESKKPYVAGGRTRSEGSGKPYTTEGSGRFSDSKYKKDNKEYKGGAKSDSYPKTALPKQKGDIRLNRYLAMSGISSRREADDLIEAGVVSVNGVIVTELGTKVKPDDVVKFNDNIVHGESKVYILMNKPKGYVTTIEDPHADKTVMDLLRNACSERIYPVGRLDKNSLGVLLFTNDGDLTKRLTHPSFNKKKIYQVSLDKSVSRADMDQIIEGVELEDGVAKADDVSYVGESRREVGVEIHSGRNRVVRRMFEHLEYKVLKLDRVYFAGLTKKNLRRGAWRFLTKQEIEILQSGKYE